MHEIESCINSRPLTFAGEDPDSLEFLTLSHFLIGRTAGFQIQLANDQLPNVSPKYLSEREGSRHQQLEKFWKLQVSDFLLNLPPTISGFVLRCNLKRIFLKTVIVMLWNGHRFPLVVLRSLVMGTPFSVMAFPLICHVQDGL